MKRWLHRSEMLVSLTPAVLVAGVATIVSAMGSTALAQSGSTRAPTVGLRFDPGYQEAVWLGSAGGAQGGQGGAARSDPEDDMRWAERRAESLKDFVRSNGSRLLRLLSEYAGAEWPYHDIDVYVVRYFPTLSIEYPLTLAVGEIRQGQTRQEIPGDDFLTLTFAHQITHYLLDPAPEELAAVRPRGFRSPLMEEGNYRREAMVNLVAYRALEDLWGPERLRKVIDEPLWASYNPEAAFVDSLRERWSLSRMRPLASWLEQEGSNGRVVKLAEDFESGRLRAGPGGAGGRPGAGGGAGVPSPGGTPRAGAMAGNDVGLDLGETSQGQLFISFLDPRSPAETTGLRKGDVVLTVEGRRFTSASEAMRAIENAWRTNREVNLSVERQGKEVFFQIH